MAIFKKLSLVLFFFASAVSGAVSQQLVLKTKKIQLLIEEWNIVNNARSVNSFQDLYDQKLTYYGERMTRKKAISLKKEFFDSNSDFRQRIASEVDYSVHSSGTIKCEFLKETWENGEWRPYLAYLLVGYRDGRFWITGESDHATDKSMGYVLDLGEPLEMEALTAKLSDSTSIGSTVESPTITRTKADGFSITDDTVTIRKDYLFILVGGFFAGGLLILLATNIRSKRKKKRTYDRPMQSYPTTPNFPPPQAVNRVRESRPEPVASEIRESVKTIPLEAEPIVQPAIEEDNSYQGIENHLKQSAFRNYVIGLFQISNFNYLKPKPNSISPGNKDNDDPQPILEFQGESENGLESFGVQCMYREDTASSDLTVFSQEHLDFNRQFVDEIDLYYLLGIGGAPEKPNGLYLIPARQLNTTVISKESLKNFRKSGLFLYYKGKLR